MLSAIEAKTHNSYQHIYTTIQIKLLYLNNCGIMLYCKQTNHQSHYTINHKKTKNDQV